MRIVRPESMRAQAHEYNIRMDTTTQDTATDSGTIDFDPDALRDKYRAERDKRLRADGNEQYLEVVGEYERYIHDPYVDPIEREPLFDEVEVLIIGGGFGGLLAGARLREAGIDDIRVVEKGGDFGGTWYWNRYPGAACDVESYIYLPLLEEIGYIPKEKYSMAAEILEHSRAIGRHFDLYRNACFQTEVTAMRWDEADGRWLVTTNRGDEMRARYICMASGPLHRPKLPGIPGIDSFQGHTFHTSRWDYDYTGGDSDGNLTGLADKRVGIIGTGATAVQCVPHLGAGAKELFVFQRTPSSIDVRDNRPTDPEWASSLPDGWQERRMENFNHLVSGVPESEDLVNDGWTDIIGNLLIRLRRESGDMSPAGLAKTMELADFEKMEQIRDRVDTIVNDPNTAEALKPYYRQFCKRPCFHDGYLATFNRPNVTLVDTDGRGVKRITERGVVVDLPGRRRRARRDRVRARLPDLRDRLRGRHRLHPPRRLRAVRPRRRDADGEVGRRCVDAARHAHARLPELLHLQQHAVGLHRQLPAHAQRAEQAPRLHPQRGEQARRVGDRGRAAGRGRVGGHDRRTRPGEP